ncbi:centriole and centriolar satellite protein OFD1 [Pleurodeles waltl]|uniref:centriole and centriolar satellite protein OFD1 n=1 Tax=Pleurodeles waltl TaxID=8319 RepID=UPI0037095488
MSSDELQALSQDELRKRLYQTFKNRGVLDTLKIQLRNQLIRELKNPGSGGEVYPKSVSTEGDSLLFRASNSLVADHLHNAGYEYTLSVFYPECGLEKERAFTVQDLLHLMKVNPKSRLYKSLTSNNQQENRRGILLHVLMELTEYHLQKESRDVDTQTVSTPTYKESVVEKLQLIDEQFADIYPKRQKFESLEGKLAVYRKEIEQRLQAEMSQKLQYFKDIESVKIRLEEKEKSRKEMSDLQQELEKAYQMKSDGLITRERNAIERLQQHQEIEAKEGYAQRQSLLKDIEIVKSREANLKQRMEAFELAEKLHEEKKRSAEDALRRRELAVKNIEDAFEQKLKNEVLKVQIELKEDYVKRTFKVTEDERRNKEEAMRLREEAMFINTKKEEMENAVSHGKELEMELNSVKAQLSLITRQNQVLNLQLQETTDYPQLKEENSNLLTQIKCLKEQLEEIKNENKQLRDRIASPTTNELVLQAQVQRVENARKLDQEEFEARRDILEKQLQREVALCAELKSELLTVEDSNKRINAQMEDLKLQLQQTQQALENEVYRNPKPSLVDRSVLDHSTDRIVPHDIYVDGTLLKSQLLSDPFVEAGGVLSSRYRQSPLRRSNSPDSDIEFVATTKARIKELEKEADYLEEAYRNYQNRVIRAEKISPPTKPTSLPLLRSVLNKTPSVFPHKVTFAENTFTSQQQPWTRLTEKRSDGMYSHHEDWQADNTPVQKKAPSSRRHSSTPIPKVKASFSDQNFAEDTNGSYIGTSHYSPDHRLSPILKEERIPFAGNASVVNQLAFPADDESLISNPLHQADCQEINDPSMPPKLMMEDFEQSDSSHHSEEAIPEQLASDASHPSVKSDNGRPVTATLPATGTSQQESTIGQIYIKQVDLEDEDKKWEEERREREERRQRERQEALEREQKELEELEREKSLREDSPKHEEKKEDIESEKTISEVLKREDLSANPIGNPLEKYMQIILQNKEQELDKSSRKEVPEDTSVTERPSDEKDDSVAAISRADTDEDFW